MIRIDDTEVGALCEEYDIRPQFDYSGRGMYGNTCFGIVGRAQDLVRFLLHVVPAIDPGFVVNTDGDDKVIDTEYSDEWEQIAQDNMAMDMIFYWPNVQMKIITEE